MLGHDERRLRLLVVTPLLPDRNGDNAGAVVPFEQLVHLAPRFDVTVASFCRSPADRSAIAQLQAMGVVVRTVDWPLSDNAKGMVSRAKVAFSWITGRMPFQLAAFLHEEMQALITGLCRNNRFDLLQIEDTTMGAYEYPRSIPAILTIHEAIDESVLPARGLEWWERRRWQSHQAKVWRLFDHIQVFTSRDAAVVCRLLPAMCHRVSVNPLGIRITSVTKAPEENARIVFVGGFQHRPNVVAVEWLVREVLPGIIARRSDVQLDIVGSKPPRSIRALASANVNVTGRVEHVEPYIAKSSVVVAPVFTGGGMRMKVLHGMGMGKAVVTTTLGTAGLAVSREELPLVVADTRQEFAQSVVRLIEDERGRRELGRRASDYVRIHHGWDAYCARLCTVYSQLLDRSTAAQLP